MAYRLDTERVELPIPDGPMIEVTKIGAWPIYRHALALVAAFLDAKGPGDELTTLQAAYAFFVREGQPTWAILDHRGPVPPTADAMLRLPVPLGLAMLEDWAATFIPKPTAVDGMIPPGPVRDELNAGLRRAKKTAKVD